MTATGENSGAFGVRRGNGPITAEAYKQQTVAQATGQTSRFLQIYEQYKKAPDVTRERMYLETMERVLGDTSKIIIDSKDGAQGVVPYLPLPGLKANRAAGGVSVTEEPGATTATRGGSASSSSSSTGDGQ